MKCNDCILSLYRKKIVSGQGDVKSPIMIIGDIPGIEEDKQGIPFVGRNGLLLRTILEYLNLTEHCYITNIVKCRTPENRQATKEELTTCKKYWTQELNYIKPKLLILLGSTTVREVLQIDTPIHILRGKWMKYDENSIMITYHPSSLQRNNEYKSVFAKDLLEVFNQFRIYNPLHLANDIDAVYKLINN